MTNRLTIQLLGRFHLTHSTAAVDLAQRPRLQAFLAYLVLHPHAVPRREISAALWPDVKESTGRNRLRNLLHQLRQLLPDVESFLEAQATTIGWREDAPCAIDVAHFMGALTLADRHVDPRQREEALAQAVDLYQGNLFPDCYDDWIAPLRTKFYNELLGAYEQLMALAEGRQDWSAAQRYAERSLAYDPLRESTYCRLMTFCAQQGDSAAVMETYRRCRALLARELDATPSERTQALYSELTLGTRPVATDTIERMPRVVHSSIPTTRRPLIGRVVELHSLQWHWDQVQQGASRLVVIQGEAGIGKSRLAAAFAHWAQQEGIAVASAACYAVEGTLAYAPIGEWIRTEPIWQTLDGLEDIWLTEVARLVPEVQSRYAHLPPPAPMHESWQQQRFFTALAITMLEHGQPLVLLLDDLQWADDETFQWLHFLLRYESPTPLLVVATVRTDDATERTRTQRLLHALTHQNLVEEITLTPLSIVDTAALAEHLMGRELFPPQVAQIFHETEGNPLFIVETVRAATEDPAYLTVPPVVDNGNAAPSRHLPPKVRSLIESRLARLSTTAAEMVQLAAVIGRRFAYPLLITVSGESEEMVLEGLEELWQQQLIREAGADRFGGRQEYDFTHDKVREVVYATLSPLRRRYLHRKVGEALSAHRSSDDELFSGQSAAHFEAAGLFTQAVAHYHKAGQFSAGLYAFQRAEQAYANAVRLARQIDLPPATVRALYDERGRLRELSGDYGSAIAIYRELEALAKVQRDDELALFAIERLATCYTEPSSVHDRAVAAALLARGIQLAQTLADHPAEARLLRTRMVDLSHYGSDEEAVQIGEQALHVARTHGLTAELASILNDLAVPLRLSGRQETAQRYASEARQLFRQSHTLPMVADNLAQEAWHHLHQLDLSAAEQTADECIALCTQIHNGWNLCLAWQTKGQVAACRGEWALALHCYETALDHGQQAGFVIGGVVTPLLLGELLRSMGETVRAQKLHYGAYIVAVKKAPFLLHAAHAQLAIHAYQRNQITSGDQWLASALESQPNGAIGRAWCVLADLPRAVVQQAQVKGNWTEALPVVETALDEASARQLPLYRPQLLLAQGTVLTALERYAQAEAVFQEALATATVATLRPIRWHLYWELSHLYQRQERTVEEQQMAHLARQEGDLLGPSFSGSVYAQPG